MALTRKGISEMNEAQLRKEVLIPLFRTMKFHSVAHYHGGTLELGKDITMWKEGELGERVNYGVVVKAAKVSGQATGKGSANEVLFQIMQCFNEPYADLTSTEQQRIQRCFVVSAKEITKEAVNAIKGSLGNNNLDKVTTFIDGDFLWQLVQQYMPEQSAMDQLRSAGDKLDQLSDHYRVIGNTRGEFSIEEKYPGAAKDNPLNIMARFEFDTQTNEGRKAFEEFERHITTGAPLSIKSPHLADFQVPEFMRRLIEPSDEKLELKLWQLPGKEVIPVKVEMEGADEQRGCLEYIELKAVRVGTEEITLDNEGQAVPWKVQLVLNYREKRYQFQLGLNFVGMNVNQALYALRFSEAVATGGDLRITHLNTGLLLLHANVGPDDHLRQQPHWIKTLERLNVIQKKTDTLLALPEKEMTLEEFRHIYQVANIVETGHATLNSDHWSEELGVEKAGIALRQFSEEQPLPVLWNYGEVQLTEILGVEVPLGPMVISCERMIMTGDDMEILRTAIELSPPGGDVTVRFTALEGCPVEVRYLDWLPAEEAVAILQSLLSLESGLGPALSGLFRAARRDGKWDIELLVTALAEANGTKAEEGDDPNPVATATPEDLRAALEPFVGEMTPETRFEFAARLFEKRLLSSGKASRLIGMDRATFLTSLHTVGVPAIDLDEEEIEQQARYVNEQ
jgi:predicted HTH domain antitoxin